MCRSIAIKGAALLLLASGGLLVFALLAMVGFIQLWYSFPDSWERLAGLAERPVEIVAMQVPEDVLLVRSASGQLYTCREQACAPAEANWSTPELSCAGATRPGLVSAFPVVLSGDIRVSLGCEKSHLDTGRTRFLVETRGGEHFVTGGPSLVPADAAVIGVGLTGGAIGFVSGLLVGGILFLVRGARARRAAGTGAAGARAPEQ